MKSDIGIHYILTIFIWLVSWTAAIEISHIDLNNHPNKSNSNLYDTTVPINDDDDDDDNSSVTISPTKDLQGFNNGVIKRTDTELTCEKTFVYDNKTFAHCYDREDCKVYGDCCRNSAHYIEREQTARDGVTGEVYNNVLYGCHAVNGADTMALMIGSCPRGTDRDVREKCETDSGENEDFASRCPVTGADTGHVYRNVYCAWCRGERRRVFYWKPAFECLWPDGRVAVTVRLEDASDRTLLYHDGRWYYADYGNRTLLPCGVRLQQPSEARELRSCGRFQVDAGLVDGCPAGTADDLARACASHTYTVFEHKPAKPRIFRNVDCARCNGVTANRMKCVPPPPPLQVNLDFSSLFAVKSAGEHRELCASDELYDVSATKCRNVIRDDLSTACRTYVALGPSEYDSRTVDNETAYVYAYKRRVRHRNGSVRATETGGGSGSLETCAEDADGLPLRPHSLPAYVSFLAYAGVVGSSASSVSLIAHLALFCRRAEPKNLPEKNLASLSVSLLLGYGSYLAIALRAVRPGANALCLASALAMHFGFMAAFAWMFIMSADVWIVLHASTKKLRVAGGRRTGRFVAYSAFAWLAPAALTAFAAVLQLSAVRALPELRPNFQHDCWFRNPRSLVALFVLPAGAIVAANYVSFAGAVRLIATSDDGRLRTTAANPTAAAVSRARKNLRIYVRLSLMMGLAWAFGLVGAVTDNDVAWTAYTVLNSLQGAFVFVAFDCKWTTIRTLAVFRKLPSVSETQTTAATPLSASN